MVECLKKEVDETNSNGTTLRLVRKLAPGSHFGELALMNDNEKRTLTVRGGSDNVKLLALER